MIILFGRKSIMRTRRFLAAAMAAAIVVTATPVNELNLTEGTITASAAYGDTDVGKVDIDGITYDIFSDHIELVEGSRASGEVVIPGKIATAGLKEEMYDVSYYADKTELPDELPVTVIKDSAFMLNDRITKVVIPEGVKTIEGHVFYDCESLEDVYIDESITDIGVDILEETPAEEKFYNGKDAMVINGTVVSVKDQGVVEIPEGAVRITPRVAPDSYERKRIVTLVIPEGVEYIGEEAFDYIECLQQIFFPSTLKTIGHRAFCCAYHDSEKCCAYYAGTEQEWSKVVVENKEYSDTILPNEFVFNQSYPLQGENGLFIGTKASAGFVVTKCSSEAEGDITVEVPDADIAEICNGTFKGCDKVTGITIPRTVSDIGSTVFTDCTALTDIYYKGTERDWNNIPEDIYIPEGVTLHCEAGEMTDPFITVSSDGIARNNGCRGDIFFGSEVKSLDCNFTNTGEITSVTFADGLESLEDKTFWMCGGLEEVHLPASVESVHPQTFEECDSLTDIWYEGSMDDWNHLNKRPVLPENTALHCKDPETGEYYTCRTISFAVVGITGWPYSDIRCRLIHNTPEPAVVSRWVSENEAVSFAVPMDTEDGEYSFEHNADSYYVLYGDNGNTVSFGPEQLNCNLTCAAGGYDVIPLSFRKDPVVDLTIAPGQTKVVSIPAGSEMTPRGSIRIDCVLLGSDSEKAYYAITANGSDSGAVYVSAFGSDYGTINVKTDSSEAGHTYGATVSKLGKRELAVGESMTLIIAGNNYEMTFRINGDQGVRTFDDSGEYVSVEEISVEKRDVTVPCHAYDTYTEYKLTARKPCTAQIAFRLPAHDYTQLSEYYFTINDASGIPAVTGKKGDANSDGKVTVADAVKVMQFICNRSKYPMTDEEQKLADLDGKEGLTGDDIIAIQQIDAGILKLD